MTSTPTMSRRCPHARNDAHGPLGRTWCGLGRFWTNCQKSGLCPQRRKSNDIPNAGEWRALEAVNALDEWHRERLALLVRTACVRDRT